MAYDKSHLSVGSVRCANERRQYGGLLMVTGLCAVQAPLGMLVSKISSDGLTGDVTEPDTIPFWSFVGGCCLVAIGICSVLSGFAECVSDSGSTRVTSWTILLTQVSQQDAVTVKHLVIFYRCELVLTHYRQHLSLTLQT